ncbi:MULTISPECIES: TonB-dependent receptor [unclassified Variovorax]|uniref:TonB-dependent receptor n=1 Tax=unclassified Variovorax TaxID=663243 RepID=UPI002577EE1E|nr:MULTISPECIES: TonB-dependent receptor [unclassified Variovorax]MDM0086587.1 TonB-dependent receptor [Variovorax sp. J22G40]MDM0145157.1 TonB-dependent receptor [Variovorax sp. J2P1-31]
MKLTPYWAGMALVAGQAVAQEQTVPPGQEAAALPTVTVTATKREQKASEIAGAVATATAEDFGPRGLQSVDQIDRVFTDVNIRKRSSRAYSNVTIRGQSSVDFYNPTAQLYVDGLPQDQALFAQLLPQALEQVEVLYGPQGTLYGRGAVGGIVSIVTRKPDNQLRFEAAGDLNAHGRGAQLLLNTPLVADTLYADVAVGTRKERGEMHDMVSGARLGDGEDVNGRLRLRYAPTGGPLDVMLTAARDSLRSDEEYYVLGPDLKRRMALPAPSHYRLRTDSLGLYVAYDFGAATLSSLTGHQDRRFDRTIFGSYTPETQKTLSQEFRLASKAGAHKAFDYVAGLYFQDLDFSREVPAATLRSQQNIRSYAAFGELSWHASERLDAVFGLRFEQERAKADTAFGALALGGEKKFDATSPKLGLNYRVADALAVYGLYSTGFKAGGFTRAVTPQNIGFTYAPQNARNLEFGFKSKLLDDRLELSGAAYFTRTSDYQLSVGPVQGQYLQNVGQVETKGASLDAQWQATRSLYLRAGVAVNDSAFSRYRNPANPGVDLTGHKVPYAPTATANLVAEYVVPLSGGARLVPRIGLSYVGKSYFNEADTISQKGYALLDLGVSLQLNKNLSADFYLDNAADRTYALYAFEAGAPYGTLYQVGRGRTAGVRVHARF